MTETRITEPRKRFVEVLSDHPRITFSELKKILVGKGDSRMNLATLYRIVDAFKDQGLLHEIDVAGERVIFPCQCENGSKNDAVTISFCDNCGTLYDVHSKLVSPYTSSITYNRMKNCNACVIR